MAKVTMLTTVDNPFDPFEQFNSWFMFDCEKGYNSYGKLMRLAEISEDMSSVEYDNAIEKAIDRLIEIDFLDIFKKITKEVPDEE